MKKSILLIIILMIIVSFSCKKQSTTGSVNYNTPMQGANEVWIQNDAFSPISITVAVNTTVKWTNKDAIAHTVTNNSGLFDSGNINNGGTYSHQFTSAGTYPYHCSIHPSMVATVIVQ